VVPQLKGLLFDFDDTLVDWSGVRLSWREIEAARLSRVTDYLYRESRIYSVNTDRLLEAYLQKTREAWAEARTSLRAPHMPNILMSSLKALGVAVNRLDADELIRAYDWNVVPGTVVFPDVPPLLKVLRSAGIKLGIVTNASQPMSMRDAELVAHGLIDYFPDCRLAAADVGYLKPHARIFNCALDQIGTTPEETVFIGDNPEADIAGANAIGMRAVLRLTGRAEFDSGADRTARPRGEAVAYRRDLLDTHRSLHSLNELPAILDVWYPGWRNGRA
jgi:putative hydrolase of the HAD superfamily